MRRFQRLGEAAYGALQSRQDVPAEVSIGGRASRFRPEIHISKWGGRAFLHINHWKSPKGRLREEGEELRGECGEYVHSYRRIDEDRFEFDVILRDYPKQGKVSFELGFPEGLEFHRQPDRPQQGTHCPEEVRGSYAVYWKDRNREFKTGKFCHIYRPKILDARGGWTWGRLEIEDGLLTITIPSRWLEGATLPITIDPTIGTTSIGGTRDGSFVMEDAMSANRYYVTERICGACTGYVYGYYNVNQNMMLAVYGDSSGLPGSLRSSSHTNLNPRSSTGQWFSGSFQIASAFSAGDYLWIAAFPAPNEYLFYPAFDMVAGAGKYMVTNFVGSPPATWVNGGNDGQRYSLYFNYPQPGQNYTRSLANSMAPATAIHEHAGYKRTRQDVLAPGTALNRIRRFTRCIADFAACLGPLLRRIGMGRKIESEGHAADTAERRSAYRRIMAESMGLATRLSGVIPIVRKVLDAVGTNAWVKRFVSLVVNILDAFTAWDYLLQRYPTATERLTIRSRITRERRIRSGIAG